MKKNLLIIAVIFILPMITYFILSSEGTKAEQKVSVPVDTPVIVKFSSPLCRDCKILAKNLETVYQKYKDKIEILIGFETEYYPELFDSFLKIDSGS